MMQTMKLVQYKHLSVNLKTKKRKHNERKRKHNKRKWKQNKRIGRLNKKIKTSINNSKCISSQKNVLPNYKKWKTHNEK